MRPQTMGGAAPPLALAAVHGLASCFVQGAHPPDPGTVNPEVQSDYDNGNWQVVVDEATSVQARSAGALILTTGLCGATFLLPHLAVTAAHCIRAGDGFLAGTTVIVNRCETSELVDFEGFRKARTVGRIPADERVRRAGERTATTQWSRSDAGGVPSFPWVSTCGP